MPDNCISDADGIMTGIKGKRRVKNVFVGDDPIDPKKTYTVCGQNFEILKNGDGQSAFNGADVISTEVCIDNQALTEYIKGELNGNIGEEYADPYGQGRITIIE